MPKNVCNQKIKKIHIKYIDEKCNTVVTYLICKTCRWTENEEKHPLLQNYNLHCKKNICETTFII